MLEGGDDHNMDNPLAALFGAFMHPPLGPGNEHHPGPQPVSETRGRTPNNAEQRQNRTLSPGGTTFIRISGPGISIQQTFSSSFGPGVQLGGSGSGSSNRGPQDPSEFTHPDGDQMRLDLMGIIQSIIGDRGFPVAAQDHRQQHQDGQWLGEDNPTPAEAGSGPPPVRREFTAFFPPVGGVRLGGAVGGEGPGPQALSE